MTDRKSSYTNILTALSLQAIKIPLHFETDREALENALDSLALPDASASRVVRIQDTLNLERLQVSEACGLDGLTPLGETAEMAFDSSGNLLPI